MQMKKSFRRRLMQVVLLSTIGISTIVILLATANYTITYIRKEQQMARKQEEIIRNALDQELESLYQLGKMMKNDGTIQRYMEEDPALLDGSFLNDVSMSLINYKKLNPNIRHLSLLRYSDESIDYVGSAWRANRETLYRELADAYARAENTASGEERISVDEDVFCRGEHVLNLFFPVYNTYSVYQQMGVICVGIPETVIQEYYSGNFFDSILLADQEGVVQSHQQPEQIGRICEEAELLDSSGEICYRRGRYYLMLQLESCSWRLVAEISILRILKNAGGVLLFSVCVMCLMCASLMLYCYKAAQKLIHPVEDLKDRMASVARGDMTIRMDVEYQEEEFNEMARSFNVMVRNVDQLMERIKEEQLQLQKIKLSALQEQIKPHFLYNTLECIHMQAVIDGNEEISRLVLALASFYRLCLGKGQDVVSLKQELSHIGNYLIIQNVRYQNIIRFHREIPEEYGEIPILKMTLQPLIENCIYHGIKVKEGRTGDIFVTIRKDGEDAVLSVSDNGEGMTQEQIRQLNERIQTFDEQNGYGVRNVNRRLKIFFGPQYGLTYRKNDGQGITVDIRIPFSRQNEEHGKQGEACTRY